MVREAEVMLGYTTVRAPFDGVVARKLAHAGDLAAPGLPLLEIEGTADFQVEAGIPDSLAAGLAPGAALAIDVPATGVTFTGRLAELSSASDAYARTVTARLAVPAGTAVRSGQFARVQVPGAPVRALLAPAAAVTTFGQMERVFVAANNRAELRLVKTGAARGDRVEILAGLSADERVVVNPPAGLREGQPLQVQP
jgi:RND family efflux transporter MFP subunit